MTGLNEYHRQFQTGFMFSSIHMGTQRPSTQLACCSFLTREVQQHMQYWLCLNLERKHTFERLCLPRFWAIEIRRGLKQLPDSNNSANF